MKYKVPNYFSLTVANEKLEGNRTYRLRGGKTKVLNRKESSDQVAGSAGSASSEPVSLPAYPREEREGYTPHTFTGQHVEDILRDKQLLQSRVEELQLDREQHRVQMQRIQAETEARERQLREEAEAKVNHITYCVLGKGMLI